MNPYASWLGERDALQTISATPEELRELFERLGADRAERQPAQGKWSAREILCHLADCEIVFAFRLRQALAQDHHVIQPFDQDKWAGVYGLYSISDALAVFASVRQWNITLVRGAGEAALPRVLTHPERGEMTFQTVIETMGGHDLNHLQQLQRLAAA